MSDEFVNVRYMVDDVQAAIDFYCDHFGFAVRSSAAPAFADVVRGDLRLLLSGPASSAGRPMPDGRVPEPGGRGACLVGAAHARSTGSGWTTALWPMIHP